MRKQIRISKWPVSLFVSLAAIFGMMAGTNAQGDSFPKHVTYEIRDIAVPAGFEISNAAEYCINRLEKSSSSDPHNRGKTSFIMALAHP